MMVLAAGLSIQDPRERPSEETGQRERATELHKRFADGKSDFIALLNLWAYLQEQQKELSSSAFRRLCKAEFINYLRVREWQDLFTQLRQLAKPLGITVAAAPIERILMRHPAISLVAVYAVPDANVGDQVMAALVLADDATLSPDELEAFLAEQADLPTKGWPRYVRVAPSLPATATNV